MRRLSGLYTHGIMKNRGGKMNNYKEQIAEMLVKHINIEKNSIEAMIETPPNSEMGDFAFPCFQLAKTMRKAPNVIAQELKEKIVLSSEFERVENDGGYINFYFDKATFIKLVIEQVISQKEKYGSSRSGTDKKALIEHTSINPNASPHIGRSRNALIGDSIVRLMRFEDFEVDVHYFVNDIGKQISMLLLGAKEKNNVSFKDLLNIYVEINNRVKENPELEKEVFELLYKLENGDSETIKGFRELVSVCINGQSQILGELGIKYDSYDYESEYILNKRTDEVLSKLKETGKLFEDSDGRLVLDLEDLGLSYLVVTRADKTSLYPLRDIAYTIDKAKTGSDKNILVLGEDQKLYFQQIKAAVSLLGYQAPEIVHYSFVLLSDGKMSTRKGTVVLLEDLMKEAYVKAKDEMSKRYEVINEETVKSIAYGAIKYSILKASNEKNVTFDWDSALNFEGDSAPYIQYSYARINSILNKYNKILPNYIDFKLLNTEIEYELAKELSNFPIVVNRTINELSPHIIVNYLYGVTKKFSNFYHECRILNLESESLKEARLSLIKSVMHVIQNGMGLLGIECPDRM